MVNIMQKAVTSSFFKKLSFIIALFLGMQFLVLETIAQNYEFTLNQRRRFDQIHVEIWAKSLVATAPKIGSATIVVQYNTQYLVPASEQNRAVTDSVNSNINQADPIDDISSPFNLSTNGFDILESQSYTAGYYALELKQRSLGYGGYTPSRSGRGTFVGKLIFNIIGNPSDNSLTLIDFSPSTLPGDIRLFDYQGNDIESNCSFNNPGYFPVVGIKILSPNFSGQTIDRDMDYNVLTGDYAGSGYPIYFERSINPSQYASPVDEDLAYLFEYSLDNGTSWSAIGRVAESTLGSSSTGNNSKLRTGEIFSANKSNAYLITTQTGLKLDANTYREPLRTIWTKNPNFTERSEQARLRITALSGYSNIDIIARTKNNTFDISSAKLGLGRLFFVQLNGNTEYIKTPDNISNSTQLTVETWINLNEYKPYFSETGIITSSAGPNATPILGSTEGAWILFLKDGRIPAFRVREIQGRGTNGYIGTVQANYLDSLKIANSDEPLSQAHAQNWVHVAATVNNNTLALYINGELVDKYVNNQATDIRMLTSVHPIWIGINPNGSIDQTDYLSAGIKGVRIWKIALSQDEIRQRVAGVSEPSNITTYGDLRRGLQLYYSFEGTLNDMASDATYQFGQENGLFYLSGVLSNNLVKYRPDRPHIRLTAPTSGSGISNKDGSLSEIRWVSYGVGNIAKAGTKDIDIEYSIDGGQNWFFARDAAGKTLGGTVGTVDVEPGTITWYLRNDSPSPDIKTITPYTREAILRVRGTEANNQLDLTDNSGYFSMAPYFSVYKSEASIIALPNNTGMNITGNTAFIEAWVRPYRFPTIAEGYFPIITKIDSTTGKFHYDLGLLPDGKLQFRVMDTKDSIRTAISSLSLVRPNSIAMDSVWTHIGAYLFLNNGVGSSEIRFYVDGFADRDTNSTKGLGTDLKLNTSNAYTTYFGYYPSKYTQTTGTITVQGSQTQNIALLGNISVATLDNTVISASGNIYDKNGNIHTLTANLTKTLTSGMFTYNFAVDNAVISWLTPKISIYGNLDASANSGTTNTVSSNISTSAGLNYSLTTSFVKGNYANDYTVTVKYNTVTLYQSTLSFNNNGTLKSPMQIELSSFDLNQALGVYTYDTTKPQNLIIDFSDYNNLYTGLTNYPQIASLTSVDDTRQITFNQDGSLNKPTSITLESYYLNLALANNVFDQNSPKNINVKLTDENSNSSLSYNSNATNLAFGTQDGIATSTRSGNIITTSDTSRGFIGEMKEIRFWNGTPNNTSSVAPQEPTPMTLFIQGALAVRANTLTNANNANLHSYFTYNGGTFVINGWHRSAGSFISTNSVPRHFGNDIKYLPTEPYIKLVEPTFKQQVANTTTDVRIRWVGFDYDGDGFLTGTTSKPPSIEFSIRGGGGQLIQPYQYVGCDYWKGNPKDALSIPSNNKYKFNGTGTDLIYALNLDATIADPDDYNDGTMKQGPLSASLTNARLRITGQYSLFTESNVLTNEGPLFSITPASNFTVRVLLEGHHDGATAAKLMNNIGTNYSQGGIRIKLYRDIGTIGDLVATQESYTGYDVVDPINKNAGNYRFGNINYIFTDLTDGDYWVKVEHINHLPILSRFPATFKYTGDDRATWRIESGWDFLSWNGIDDNVLTLASSDPTPAGLYTAYGYAKKTYTDVNYSTTGLIFNDGRAGSLTKALAAMVGGDVNQDLQINAADRVKVRQDDGTGLIQSDITGDGFVNADDRTITDRNFGKVSSVYNVTFPDQVAGKINIAENKQFEVVSELNPELSNYFNANAKNIPLPQSIDKPKNEDVLFAGLSYDVTGEPVLKGDSVLLSMYVRNKGGEFAFANCTFAVKYNSSVLNFIGLAGADSVIFNDKPDLGYANLRTAPTADAVNPIPEIRTIEVDYDAYANLKGEPVPYTKTYLGTLKFKLKTANSSITFLWHESTSVHSTKNGLVTSLGNFIQIPPILLYSANLVNPNGGEKFSQNKNASVNWTTNGNANVYVLFTADNEITWDTLNATPININQNSFTWTTPNFTSTRCKIRIIDSETGYVIDQSDSNFSIVPSFAQVIRPSSGDPVYIGGKTDNIKWSSQGYDKVRFEFSADGGTQWESVSSVVNAGTGIQSWALPKITTKTAIVRMIDVETNIEIARSSMFKILTGTMTFKTPIANETLIAQKTTRVRWTSSDINTFDLQISYDCAQHWTDLQKNVSAFIGYINWEIPDTSSECVYIRAIWNSDPEMEFARTGAFKIISTKSVEDNLPAGVEFGYISPNPVKDEFGLSIKLPNESEIQFAIYSYTGELLNDLGYELIPAGDSYRRFGSSGLANGKYLLIAKSGYFTLIRELIIQR